MSSLLSHAGTDVLIAIAAEILETAMIPTSSLTEVTIIFTFAKTVTRLMGAGHF